MLSILATCCANVATAEPTAKALSYYTSGNYLWIVTQLLALVIPGLLLIKKYGYKMEKLSWKLGMYWLPSLIIFLALYQTFSYALGFPLEMYTGYFREKAYGLSQQTYLGFFIDSVKGFCVGMISSIFTLSIFYAIMKVSVKRWWIYAGCASFFVAVFGAIIQPVWIDPLFNTYTSLENVGLEKDILALAQKAGIEHSRVFEVDKSRQTTLLNAYVTGVGQTNRIVLWDTLVNAMTPKEILFVMGHEMGHYVLHHVWYFLIANTALYFGIFFFIYRFGLWIMHRYGKILGVTSFQHFASLPLIVILFNVAGFVTNPFMNALSRHLEHQADIFGLEITQNNQAAGNAFVRLQCNNLANPRPGALYMFFRATHPSLAERIELCNRYCPWKEGKPLEYQDHFKHN